jgi:hypothetical protein
VLALFLAANHPLVLGWAYPLWDADRQGSTWQMLIADCARQGHLLLWNPWSAAGIPEFAEPQTGALSPLAIASGLLTGGRLRGFVAYWLGLWFLGGAGLFGLGRYLGAPRWGAALVAIGYLFSGFYLGHAEHVSWIYAYSALPYIVWWFDRSQRERSLRLAIETGALWGLSGLGGYPGLLVITAGLLPLWAIGRRLAAGSWRESRAAEARRPAVVGALHDLVRLGIVAVVGLVILAPVYHGYFREAAGYSTRIQAGGWSRELAIQSNALEPRALATLASPWLTQLQIKSAHRLWPGTDVSSCSVYLGPFIPWLALMAILGRPRDRWRWWLAGLAALLLMIAVGDRLPFRGWLYDLLPPFRFFRHAAMFRGYAIFLVSVLALLGTVDLHPSGPGRRWTGALAALGWAGLAWGAFFGAVRAGSVWIERVPMGALIQLAGWGIVPLLALLVLHPTGRRWGLRLALLVAGLDAMATVQLGQATLYTEDPAARRTWQALEARYTPELDLLAPARPRVLQLGQGLAHNKNLVVKRPTLVNYTALINVYHDSLAAVPALAGLALGPARTWFTAEAITAPMSDRIRDALVSRTQAGRGVPLIVHPPASMPGVGTAGDSAIAAAIHAAQGLVPAKVTFTEYRPRRLSLTAVVERDGWLFVTDRWAPGWRATVDRKPVPIWGANAVFRAVRVHAGSNAVQFDYRPAGLPILLALSWGLLAAALVSAGGRWLLRSGGAQRAVEEAGAARASAPDISLIIPSYDSAAYIGRTLAALVEHVERHGWDAEILVIDDGSSDSTPAIVRGAIATHGERVRLLHHARNAGKGAAVRSGMLAAHGRRRVFTDSDLPYSLQDLSAVVAALGEADVVVGSRGGPKMSRIGSRKRGAAGPGRGSASRWFSRLATRAFRLPVEDPQCGLKGFTAEAAQRIFHRSRVNGFSFDVEALAIAQAHGLRVRVVPVTLRRQAGSSVHILRHSIQMLAELGWIRLNLLRGRYR